MLLSRTSTLLICLALWAGTMLLVFRREGVFEQIEVISLTSLVFNGSVDRFQRKEIYFTSNNKQQWVGSWKRSINESDDVALVHTRITLKIPEEFLRALRGSLGSVAAQFPMIADLLKDPSIEIESTTKLHRETGFMSSKTRQKFFGRLITATGQRDGDRVRITLLENGQTRTLYESLTAVDAEIGFYRFPAPYVGDERRIAILDLTDIRRPMKMIRVRVEGREKIEHNGETVNAYVVRGVEPYQKVVAYYDSSGRVLRERGVFFPLYGLMLTSEKLRPRREKSGDEPAP